MSRSTLKPKGPAQITARDVISAGSSFLKGVGGVAATLLNTTSAQAGQIIKSQADFDKKYPANKGIVHDGGELPKTTKQPSSPKGPAQNRSTLKPVSIGLEKQEIAEVQPLKLSGLITIKEPIKVVKDNKVITEHRDPTQNWHDELGNYVATQNTLRRNVEQGNTGPLVQHELSGNPLSRQNMPDRPGNTKMQDYRAKGESILKKAKDEGRMLSDNEQRRLKSLKGRHEKQYQKNK